MALALLPTLANGQSSAAEDASIESMDDEASRATWDAALVGGVGGFTGGLSSATDIGPVWGVEVDVPVWNGLQLELGYRGFEFPITDTRVIQQSVWAHGARGALKLSVPYTRTVSPFMAVGVGFLLLDPTDEAQTLFRSDGAFELPASVGIQFETEFLEASIRTGWSGLLGQSLTREERLGTLKGGVLTSALSLGIRL